MCTQFSTRACSRICLPSSREATSIKFADNGTALVVALNTEAALPAPLVPCALLFDAASGARLGAAQCGVSGKVRDKGGLTCPCCLMRAVARSVDARCTHKMIRPVAGVRPRRGVQTGAKSHTHAHTAAPSAPATWQARGVLGICALSGARPLRLARTPCITEPCGARTLPFPARRSSPFTSAATPRWPSATASRCWPARGSSWTSWTAARPFPVRC